jgi:hypothetical protein
MKVTVNARQSLLDHIPPGSVGAEIGVFKGAFSEKLLKATKAKKLYLIDPWVSRTEDAYDKAWYGKTNSDQAMMDTICKGVRRRFAAEIEAGTVEILRMESSKAAAMIPDESLDFVYIDGDHSYEGVRDDLANYLPKVRAGGLICGDDYGLGAWWGDGVLKALHEFLPTAPVRIDFLIDAQFCLRKR